VYFLQLFQRFQLRYHTRESDFTNCFDIHGQTIACGQKLSVYLMQLNKFPGAAAQTADAPYLTEAFRGQWTSPQSYVGDSRKRWPAVPRTLLTFYNQRQDCWQVRTHLYRNFIRKPVRYGRHSLLCNICFKHQSACNCKRFVLWNTKPHSIVIVFCFKHRSVIHCKWELE